VTAVERLTSGRILARNSVMNLGTGGTVLVLNIIFVPMMLRAFGLELYGVLAVTWMVLGHLRWLDLGFSAACARFVSRDLAAGDSGGAGLWAWRALAAQTVIGLAAGACLWAAAPLLAGVLKVSPEAEGMVILALRLFALVVPLDLASRTLTGVLEGTQRFGWINAIHLGVAAWTFATYSVGLLRGGDFLAVLVGLVLLKVAQLIAVFVVTSRVVPSLRSRESFSRGALLDRARIVEMARFGGWVTLSAGAGPLLLFVDRWVIGTLRGVAALPLYTVPFNLLMSLFVLPSSLSTTLFPAFSALSEGRRWDRIQDFFVRAHRYLLLILLPLIFGLFLWAPELLRIWVGADFAAEAALPFRILIVGFGVGFFAPFSGALLQGAGRPDILSKVYLVELVPNAILTVVLVRSMGITGAAIAFAVRTTLETVALLVIVHRIFPLSPTMWLGGSFGRTFPVAGLLIAAGLLLPAPSFGSPASVAATAAVLVLYGVLAAVHLMEPGDRVLLAGLTSRRAPAG
jgi:O-antigen/teichoic acid export membrane protein